MMDTVSERIVADLRGDRRDLVAFMAAFAVGVVFYLAMRLFAPLDWGAMRQALTTAGLVAVMGTYSLFVLRTPQARVRLDQAGDNAYYLGLLFTLISMAFALWEFSRNQSDEVAAEEIISNFGIALATTIAGIFLRVVLHQMRQDPADVEAMTRIELSEATKRVTMGLNAMTLDLNRFCDEVRQRASDSVGHAVEASSKGVAEMEAGLKRTTDSLLASTEEAQSGVLERTKRLTLMLEEVATEALAACERLREVKAPPVTLSNRLTQIATAIEASQIQLQGATAAFAAAGEGATVAGQRIGESAQALAAVRDDVSTAHRSSAERLAQMVVQVDGTLRSLGEGLARDRDLLRELEAGTRRSIEESQRAQDEAAGVLRALTAGVNKLGEHINRGA